MSTMLPQALIHRVDLYRVDEATTSPRGAVKRSFVPIEGKADLPCYVYVLDPTTRPPKADNGRDVPDVNVVYIRITFGQHLDIQANKHVLRWADPYTSRVRWFAPTSDARNFTPLTMCWVICSETTA